MNVNRVFITGYAALTSCGSTINDTWNSIINGETGIAEISSWDLSSWKSSLGGEIKNFQPRQMLADRKLLKVIARQDVIGLHVVQKAIEHSALIDYRNTLTDAKHFNESTGIYVGSPGNKYFQQYEFLPLIAKSNNDMKVFAAELFNEVHPMWLLKILPNNVLAYTAINYGFKGANHNVTNHAVGGLQALIEAYNAIKYGQIDRAVVVGYDIGIDPQALFYYDKLGVLSGQHLKSFDKSHDGTILADGAAAVILESNHSVSQRNTRIYAEVLSGASTTEAENLFSISNDGQALVKLIQKNLKLADISADALNLVVAHGNGNVKSDDTEALALDTIFASTQPPVTAFKWATGHTLAASGILDTVLTTISLQNNCIPGIANLENLATNCANLNVSQHNRIIDSDKICALIINRGFASMNACLTLRSNNYHDL